MSTFIDLDDGRSWRAANWAYDAVIECIAGELDRTGAERELATWLRAQTCRECGPGLGSVDVRELSPASALAFRRAAQRAFDKAVQTGGAGWNMPSFFSGWLDRFQRLLLMWEAIDRGEPPGRFGDSVYSAKPSGRQIGPGWETAAESRGRNGEGDEESGSLGSEG